MSETDSKSAKNSSTAPEGNIWNSILSEASRAVSDRLEQRTVLLLGERNCGKSSLVARLQGIDISEAGKGVALDYSYIDITNELDDEPIARLNVWQLEGEEEHKNLLRFALNADSIANSLVIITIDFSQPWDLVLSLQRWLKILESHIQSIHKQIDRNLVEEMKNYQVAEFQQYVVPTGNSDKGTVQKVSKKKKLPEEIAVPLGEGVLENNLGIPIVVVCTKTDSVFQLEKEYGIRDPHFEYIHPMLRKICLSYGAALIYTSSKKDRNIDTLMKYVNHRLYGFEFHVKPIMEVKETMFIPSGYDSMSKIKIDFDSQTLTKEFDAPFDEIIKIPKSLILQADNDEPFIVAEEDQEYLENWKEFVDKDPVVKSAKPQVVQAVGTGLTSMPTTPDKPTPPNSASSPAGPLTPDAKQQEHQAFANFFSNLMNRDSRGATNIAPLSLPGSLAPLSLPGNLGSRLPASPALKSAIGAGSTTTSPSNKINTSSLGGLSNEEIAKHLERVKGGKP